MFLKRFFASAVLWSSSVFAVGEVIKVTRDTPVFAKASPRSKVLADADAGTALMLRAISPKKTWLLVEDEDGHKGWVPKERTDYVIEPPPEPGLEHSHHQDGAITVDEERKKMDEEEKMVGIAGWQHHLGLMGRGAFRDPGGRYAAGLNYSIFFPVTGGQESRQLSYGFQVGALWQLDASPGSALSVPLRFRLLARGSRSHLATGPDIGALLSFVQPKGLDSDTLWGLSLGYSLGYLPYQNGFYALVRPGVDFFHSTRLSVELNIGWVL